MLLTFTAPSSSMSVLIVCSSSGLNSLYQRYCQVTRRIVAATVSLVFFCFSNTLKIPVRALGLKRWERHAR